MSLEKINNLKVKPLPVVNKSERKFRGKKLFEIWCPNIFLLAKKNSGKTTNIDFILNKCTGPDTTYILIVSSIDNDPSWKLIVNNLEEKGRDCATYKSIIDDDGNNIIEQFLEENKKAAELEDEELPSGGDKKIVGGGSVEPPLNNFMRYQLMAMVQAEQTSQKKGGGADEDELAWKKPYPKYVIVMDDLGSSMRDKYVTQLLKTNRHFDTMVIISSQSLTDLDKPARSQIDYMLIYPKIPIDKLKSIKDDLNLSIEADEFEDKYNIATEEKYNFLYIGRSTAEEEYRKNFDQKFKSNNGDK